MQNRFKQLFTGIVIYLVVFAGQTLKAQSASDLRFNEVLVYNDSNYVDEFGLRSGWIEIVNSSFSNVNIAGCYLTDDLNNPTKYWIPTGTQLTALAPRGFILFFADDHPSRGIFHLNFTLEEGKTIALVDANGRTIIDKLELGKGHRPDVSYARLSPDHDSWEFKEKTTPGSDNDHSKKASSGEKFVQIDPAGMGLTLVAMFVVFSSLAILYIFYKMIGRLFTRTKKAKPKKGEAITAVAPVEQLSGEVNAAIAMTLYLYQTEMHDFENTVLTIKKVSRSYSPWSSKIYTLRKTPR